MASQFTRLALCRQKSKTMNRSKFIRQMIGTVGLSVTLAEKIYREYHQKTFAVRLLRHATLVVEAGQITFLIDPMLGAKDSMEPVKQAGNDRRIPMVDLPLTKGELKKLIDTTDAVMVTHTHRDHWDAEAINLIPKDKPLICQPADVTLFQHQGFTQLFPVDTTLNWQGIDIHRTGGQHGTGETGKRMGPVSGFVLKKEGEVLYVAGDTIWCEEVQQAIQLHQPGCIIVNAGAATFTGGDPITMHTQDVIRTARAAANSQVIAVHMETVNHCMLTREQLLAAIRQAGLTEQVRIPADGDWAI